MKKLVIVESPTKAKTIRRFLSKDYVVESCMGHIRDLPGSIKELPEEFKKYHWARFGVNVDKDFHPVYCVPSSKKAVVKKLKDILKSAKELILATDEDREGESISWHLKEILKPKVPVKRMVFHEITQSAIEEALKNFRSVDNHLVQAQEARRILDRLVGYSISPLLWQKVLRGLSAGRVQSVAVSLISNRELERLAFQKTKYWDLVGEHKVKSSGVFTSRLTFYKGRRLARSSDFDSITGKRKTPAGKGASASVLLMAESTAKQVVSLLSKRKFKVQSVEKKQITRKPFPPFITSTLQQECNRQFRFSSRQTMVLAQKLYEQGLITYMRTDSTFLSTQALQATRAAVSSVCGKNYLPPTPRVYRKKAKGAQEAHEAIRPVGQRFRAPNQTKLSGDMLKLYDLIWKRTLSSQMKDCIQNQTRVEMQAGDGVFVSSGVTIQFPGFYRIYKGQQTEEVQLPDLKKGDEVSCLKLEASGHETKPPARYTEASLIQKLEEEGVGRPSTYASIISTIQDRGYVKKEKNSLIPTFVALVVDRLLAQHFPDYVNVQFTSQMEKDLDQIARGKTNHVKYLNSFYLGSKGLKNLVENQEKKMKKKTFRSLILNGFEEYSFNVGPFGAYVSKKNGKDSVSATLPTDLFPGDITKSNIETLIQNKIKGGRLLGKNPITGKDIFVVLGRYGPYLEMSTQAGNEKTTTAKGKSKKKISSQKSVPAKNSRQKLPVRRVSLSPFYKEDTITLEGAVQLLELPKVLGKDPKTKKEVKKGVGRFGPYIVHDGDFRSVPAEGFFDITLKEALQRIKEPKKGGRGSQILKELGAHPKSGKLVQLMKGRYGPYIKYDGKNYALSSHVAPDQLTLKEAVDWMANNTVKKSKKSTRLKKINQGAARKKTTKKTSRAS